MSNLIFCIACFALNLYIRITFLKIEGSNISTLFGRKVSQSSRHFGIRYVCKVNKGEVNKGKHFEVLCIYFHNLVAVRLRL
jgi:hypothetical protein